MKKILYILLTIDIISLTIGFFASLSVSLIISVIILLLGILNLVPLIAIISNIDNIENLYDELNRMKYKLKALSDDNKSVDSENISSPTIGHKEKARGAWECVKCGTINKEGTDSCQNCKALYSPAINPTTNPFEKKKVSRWVNDKNVKNR